MSGDIEIIELSDDEVSFKKPRTSTSPTDLDNTSPPFDTAFETPPPKQQAPVSNDENYDSETVPDSFVDADPGHEGANKSEVQVAATSGLAMGTLQCSFRYASSSIMEIVDSTPVSSAGEAKSVGSRSPGGFSPVLSLEPPSSPGPRSPSPEVVFEKVDTVRSSSFTENAGCIDVRDEFSFHDEFAVWEQVEPLPPPLDIADEPNVVDVMNDVPPVAPDPSAEGRSSEPVLDEDVSDQPQPGPSNSSSSPQKKRRRNKEEIEQEKLLKEVNRVRREMKTAKNSKCEQYLYCYISTNIRALDDAIERELNDRFTERDTSEQLVFSAEDLPIKVTWKRKCIHAFVEDGKLHRVQTMEPEGVFAIVLDADSFLQLVKPREIVGFVQNAVRDSGLRDVQPTVIVLGKHSVRENVLSEVLFDCFEQVRCQFRFVNDAKELSYLIAQMHRALAKREKKLERAASDLPVINSEKGIREGPGLVRDWWARMLSHMHRLSEEQKRALVDRYPDPFPLMRRLSSMPAGEAMHEIANVMGGNGRRVGPVVAQKIYKLLTSFDGEEILDNED